MLGEAVRQSRRETRVEDNNADTVACSRQRRSDGGAVDGFRIACSVNEDESPVGHSVTTKVQDRGLVLVEFNQEVDRPHGPCRSKVDDVPCRGPTEPSGQLPYLLVQREST